MTATEKHLTDRANRITAMTAHDRSLLVEAGAGSGKTAVMAGRVVMMLAGGINPRSIAAVTFTELAASELLARVRDFVEKLVAGEVPVELQLVLPDGPSQSQVASLRRAADEIDEITCSTIHGFCQKLIKPYPAEAGIDPGAAIADRNAADLAFSDLRDTFVRERLGEDGSILLAEMVAADPKQTVLAVRRVSDAMRRWRDLSPPQAEPLPPLIAAFQTPVRSLRELLSECPEEETAVIVGHFEDMLAAVSVGLTSSDPAALVAILYAKAHADLCTRDGFKSYRKKGKWEAAAASVGLGKAAGARISVQADGHYTSACEAWLKIGANAAARVLSDLVEETRPLLDRFAAYKRDAALLDFDDLLYSARDLIRKDETVRQALARRFTYVLVDEFQDTDPIQAEIFWRLCGEDDGTGDWQRRVLRPGSLFLVGDPKQAIYRFRGADVQAYVAARSAIEAQDPSAVLSIATNFRSCASILSFVNGRFAAPLSPESLQPGFTALEDWHPDHSSHPCVAALDVMLPETVNAEVQRRKEAEAIAEFCARLIGSHPLYDHKLKSDRPCRAGDIALLAPTGTDLWLFEEALERRGIAVATQAGKGFYRRQEIQDLIALTRVLADGRDTLALGALLRGPLVGLTEEQLLDLVWELREDGDKLPRLSLHLDSARITHPVAKDALERLKVLAMRANSTTPHDLLSQAVAEMRVRPTLVARHRGQAERALANVDMYLSMARHYGVRGLRDFAEAMTAAWSDEAKAGEGRPDAQEESVSLITMHSAKGLEWPVVIPVNTSTRAEDRVEVFVDRATSRLYCKIFGVAPIGFDDAAQGEKGEVGRERVRVWYVAATRAREMLVIPRASNGVDRRSWLGVVDMTLGDLPSVEVSGYEEAIPPAAAQAPNAQTRQVFADEAKIVVGATRGLRWKTPSLHEGDAITVAVVEPEVLGPSSEEAEAKAEPTQVRGGRERGLVMHKLFEEILTGETAEEEAALVRRADELLRELGKEPSSDPKTGFSPAEIGKSVIQAMRLPEVAAVRSSLVPECHVYRLKAEETEDAVTFGIADAIAFDGGTPSLVIDWKSDVDPDEKTIAGYRSQLAEYLAATGVAKGLIVFATLGTVDHMAYQ